MYAIAAARPAAASDGWFDDLDAGLAEAERTGKPVLVHFSASWCGPCRRMEAEVFPSPKVRTLLREEVVGVKLDADRNQALSRQWGVDSIPADVLLTPEGVPVSVMSGFKPASRYAGRLTRLADRVTAGRALVAKQEEKVESTGRRLVGLAGHCPVTVATEKRWTEGSWEHAVEHFGVTYLLADAKAERRFRTRPIRFTPRLSGCDPVAFAETGRAKPGSVRTAALYDGAVVLFASAENRRSFSEDPARYLAIRQVMLPEELVLALGPDDASGAPRFAGLPRFRRAEID